MSRGRPSNSEEEALAQSVKKALDGSEVAPKQKHVRACILFTWDYKRSEPFWAMMRASPVLGDEVQTWKALVVVHKVLRGGHPIVSFHRARRPFGPVAILRNGISMADASLSCLARLSRRRR